jgi:hypothetical protein
VNKPLNQIHESAYWSFRIILRDIMVANVGNKILDKLDFEIVDKIEEVISDQLLEPLIDGLHDRYE